MKTFTKMSRNCKTSVTELIILLAVLINFVLKGTAVPAGADDQPKEYQQICADHPPVSNTKTSNSSKWNNEGKPTNERHLHIGNKIARQKIASVIHGRDLDDDKEDYSKLCAGMILEYKEGHAEALVYGYGTGEKAQMILMVHPDIKGAMQFIFTNKVTNYILEVTSFIHYIDNVIVTTWCFSDGKVGWGIWSTADVLKPEEKKIALDYIQSVGFDPKEEVPLYELGNCPNIFNKN